MTNANTTTTPVSPADQLRALIVEMRKASRQGLPIPESARRVTY